MKIKEQGENTFPLRDCDTEHPGRAAAAARGSGIRSLNSDVKEQHYKIMFTNVY